jgi:hypothetical protein
LGFSGLTFVLSVHFVANLDLLRIHQERINLKRAVSRKSP